MRALTAVLAFVAVCLLAKADIPQKTDCMTYMNCPTNSGYPYCNLLYIAPANAALNNFWSPWPGAGSFSAGEFYANEAGSNLMDAALGNEVPFVVQNNGAQWYTDLGILTLNLTLLGPTGYATMSSTNFFLRQAADPCTGKPIWYPGGDFLVEFHFDTPNAYYTQSQTVTFVQSNNMLNYWPCGGPANTVTDRLVNFTEWSQLPSAPLFGHGTQPYSTGVANYDAGIYDGVVIMWGSAGYNYGQNNYYSGSSFTGPKLGMDLAFGVSCTPNNNLNMTGTPVNCPGCAHAGADPNCNYARADTNDRTCVSLSFDTPNNGCIFDKLM